MKLQTLLLTVALCLLLQSCRKEASDPRIPELQKDVAKLSEENLQLQSEVQALKQKVEELEVKAATPVPASTAQTQAPRVVMTLDRMKAEVAPVLEAQIRKIKLASDTPQKGSAYGMRVEYDTKHAVYGLVQSKDRKALYGAKVVVKFEKFLESENDSRNYDSGSQEFRFVYKNGKWSPE